MYEIGELSAFSGGFSSVIEISLISMHGPFDSALAVLKTFG